MKTLKNNLSVFQGIAMAVSLVIGSGLLGLPGLALETGGLAATSAGWVVTTMASLPFLFILMRLGLRFRSSAGLARYAEAAAGEWAGSGVVAVMVGTFALGIPALAIIGGAYAQRLFGLQFHHQYWLAIAILTLATVVNARGVTWTGAVNSASLMALIVMVAYLTLSHPGFSVAGVSLFAHSVFNAGGHEYTKVWSVCSILVWAYFGWENLSFGLEEFRNPSRSIPLVFWGSFMVVVILYLSLAAVTLGAASAGLDVSGPAGLIALVGHPGVRAIVNLVMVLAILANANAWIFSASRLACAAGQKGILPGFLGTLSKHQLPMQSLWVLLALYLSVIAIARLGIVTLSTLIGLVSQNFLVLYGFIIVAFIRTETHWFRWPIAVAGAASCLFFLSGFLWWLACPATLLTIGYLVYRHHRVRKC
ncbi:MAG: APC family permease [Lentisphaerota bacterium]